ncbi:autophagy protein 9 [Heterostelium album PN500]|uniref:Autophagy-related protein 9 n=1 Tax=Heterostelium pallidum (strain ATCC 26659 / Pp 5 / PN500) TaxID=670386 RepID=D3BQ47_HETP5|nr:autophagy protein 9 [Heterostelium album PN500]EFA76267.1 autophagy protein 9 [Heterostelium album PN500]|eukprot:XP_020428399.1 autophagy protein 9 [Heterostelium album PN500]
MSKSFSKRGEDRGGDYFPLHDMGDHSSRATPSNNSYRPTLDDNETFLEHSSPSMPAIHNLDNFLTEVYNYFTGKGFLNIFFTQLFELLTSLFVIVFFTFLVSFINYDVLFRNNTSTMVQYHVVDFSRKVPGWLVLFLVLFSFYWFAKFFRFLISIRSTLEIRSFYHNTLKINEDELQTVDWSTIASKLVEVPRLCRVKENMDALDIANRIMRKENYIIGMIDRKIFDLSIPFPFLRKYKFITKTLEWSIMYALFNHIFDANGVVKDEYLDVSKRERLSRGLTRRFRMIGIIGFFAAPFVLIFLLITYFFKYAEEIKNRPGSLGSREWSPLAKWKFREFNELPHFFNIRLNLSYSHANKYVDSFPSELISTFAKFVSFLLGAILAVFIVFGIISDDFLFSFDIFGRAPIWYVGTYTVNFEGVGFICIFGTFRGMSRYGSLSDTNSIGNNNNNNFNTSTKQSGQKKNGLFTQSSGAKQDKLEMSVVNFKIANPDWTPPDQEVFEGLNSFMDNEIQNKQHYQQQQQQQQQPPTLNLNDMEHMHDSNFVPDKILNLVLGTSQDDVNYDNLSDHQHNATFRKFKLDHKTAHYINDIQQSYFDSQIYLGNDKQYMRNQQQQQGGDNISYCMEIPSIQFLDYPIEWRCSPNEGRYLVASKDLEIGEIVLVARSFLSIESDLLRKQTCHNCLEYQNTKASDIDSALKSSVMQRCVGCNEVYWCSESCYSIGSAIHQRYECQYFKKLRSYNNSNSKAITGDNMTEVKMIVGILGRYIDIKYKHSEEKMMRPDEQPTFNHENKQYPIIDSQIDDVLQLVENTIDSNTNSAACDLIEQLTAFINQLFTDILNPPQKKKKQQNNNNNNNKSTTDSCISSIEIGLNTTSLNYNEENNNNNSNNNSVINMINDVTSKTRSLICKIRCNQFGIWSKRDKCIGVSCTPAASYFNHSCCPNLADVRGTTVVVFKALHFISKGTPISISYLDLDQPTHERQSYLKTFYYFTCQCLRCKDQTDESDNWISRFYCDRFKCSGTYFLDDRQCDIKESEIVMTCSYCYKTKSMAKHQLTPPKHITN